MATLGAECSVMKVCGQVTTDEEEEEEKEKTIFVKMCELRLHDLDVRTPSGYGGSENTQLPAVSFDFMDSMETCRS